jgi:hypothetical protein
MNTPAATGRVTFHGKVTSKFHRLAERDRKFEPMGACGFRSRGNDRQGRRLGGPKVERAHRRVSEAAPCLDGVRRDLVCADIFVWNGGAGAGCAGAKFAVSIIPVDFVSIAFVTVRAAVFAVVAIESGRFVAGTFAICGFAAVPVVPARFFRAFLR